MSTGNVVFEIAGGVVTLRLHNPSRRNAMSIAMWHQLAGYAADLTGREDVRVVIVRGEGEKAFSAGADIGDFATRRGGGDAARAWRWIHAVDEHQRPGDHAASEAVALRSHQGFRADHNCRAGVSSYAGDSQVAGEDGQGIH